MAPASSSLGLPVIPATPPEISLLDDDFSDLDDLPEDRIPATSPFVTQPTQIVTNASKAAFVTQPTQIISNPTKTLRTRKSSPPHLSDLSSSPPRPPTNPPTLTKQGSSSGFPPRRNQVNITKFFSRPLSLSPKMTTAELLPPRPSARPSLAKPTVPRKRTSDIIDLSDDDEDELASDRADIKPTTFSRAAPKLAILDSPPRQKSPARLIDFESFKYNSSAGSSKAAAGNPPTKKAKTDSNTGKRNKSQKAPRVVIDSDESEPEVKPVPRRRKLVQGLRSTAPSSPPSSSGTSLGITSQVSTKATTPEEPIAVLSDSDSEAEFDGDEVDVASSEEDTQLLKLMNDLDLGDLAALTGASESDLQLLIKKRPFHSLAAVEKVSKIKEGRGKQKGQVVEIGEVIMDKTRKFMTSIAMVDKVVAEVQSRANFLKGEVDSWDIDARGLKREVSAELKKTKRNGSTPNAFVHTPPKAMSEEMPMHDFQIFGVNWMSLLFRNGYGGILADDMGLGKTCQVIGLMARMQDDYDNGLLKDYPFPNLIIVPPSTLDNWVSEFEKFAPDLNVIRYSGSRAARTDIAEELAEDPHAYHAIITTYTQFSQKEDLSNLNHLGLNAAIFDEGQILKNPTTLQYQRLHQLRTRWRLLLSGTPIQNHLMEMISLLNFVDPGLFKDRMEAINYVFDHKIHTRNLSNTALLYGERVNRARSILEPFILQRLKDQVGQNLPPKTHSIVYCDLPEGQREWYDKYENLFRMEPNTRPKQSAGTRGNDLNNVWMQLKKAALHPQLFRRHFTDEIVDKMAKILFKSVPHRELDLAEPRFDLLLGDLKSRSDFDLHLYCRDFAGLLKKFDVPAGSWGESGKVMKLLELIREYKRNGDRVLVFSKFTKVIDIVAYALSDEGIDFCTLTGNSAVGDRQSQIDRFQKDPDIPVFLLTTGAGGTGINLTAANKVIIFDMSSNPQDDKQAENRAHRLGQTRGVEVIHLISRGTVEELIYKTCQKKIELAEKVTNAGGDSEGKLKEIVKEMLVSGETLDE
ncbi:related to enhancer-trap-locus-1 protein [Cephalotrichum gorgonifer]|uniref:Related to enhancer-trap-locus-1 protein n=1 Tax=Cephalotrichum gorgonifer TaxID=2041049 RepID=A0AAE8MQA1_9PEZI|nr:related to enhancer-trap-locus-1 protein [Cephalotrichum gorgonifer]